MSELFLPGDPLPDSGNRSGKHFTEVEDRVLESLYKELSYKRLGEVLGRSEASIRTHCYEKGFRKAPEDWTTTELHLLFSWYASNTGGRGDLNLDELAEILGRHKTNVCRKARELGLTDGSRPVGDLLLEAMSARSKAWHEVHEHPRGMLGKSQGPAARQAVSEATRERSARTTKKAWRERGEKMVATKIERYGSGNPASGENAYSRCKRGRREDLGIPFFRSMWEANYARYLNLLVQKGKVIRWEYEPQTFVFHGVTRGAVSYLPDFKVWNADGTVAFHEVKGWMDGKSKTKLRRMKQFYPEVKLIVIGEKEYKAISEWAVLIPNWEVA
jgi:hypothetical protein